MKRRTPLVGSTPAQRATRLTRKAITWKRRAVTPEERKSRKLVAARSGRRCEVCLRAHATNVHHRRNRSQGGSWSPENLLHLCGSGTTGCHGRITANPRVALGQGWTVPSHRDPADVPVWLGDHGYCFLNADGSITETEEEVVA